MHRLREWLITKLIGNQTIIMNIDFADVVMKKGRHVIHKTILIQNQKTN